MTYQLTAGDLYIPRVPALNSSGAPLTGYTSLRVYISRDDDYQYDFADATFKASGWTTRQATMTEVSATNAPGWYKYGAGFDTTGLADGRYILTYVDAGSSAYGLPAIEDVQIGTAAGGGSVDLTATNAAIAACAQGTALTAAVNAIDAHTDSAVAGLATASGITAAVLPLATASALAAVATSVASCATASGLSSAVAAIDAHTTAATGPLATASALSSLASTVATLPTSAATAGDVTAARDAVKAYGDLHWITATGFAVAGSAMSLAAGALTSTAIGSGFVAAVQSGLSTLTAAGVWTAAESSTTGTFGAALVWLRDRFKNKQKLGVDGVLRFYAPDGTTVLASKNIKTTAGVNVTPTDTEAAEASADF